MKTQRTTLEQRKIAELIKQYESAGYQVFAEVPGYQRPDEIDRFVPDIVVRKGEQVIIIEVKTSDTLPEAKQAVKTFSDYAERIPNVRFDLVMTNPRPALRERYAVKSDLLADLRRSLLSALNRAYDANDFASSIVLGGMLLENILRGLALKEGLIDSKETLSLNQFNRILRTHGIISNEVSVFVDRLVALRNQAVHGQVHLSKSEARDFKTRLTKLMRLYS